MRCIYADPSVFMGVAEDDVSNIRGGKIAGDASAWTDCDMNNEPGQGGLSLSQPPSLCHTSSLEPSFDPTFYPNTTISGTQISPLTITTSTENAMVDRNTFSATPSAGSADTGLRPYTPQSALAGAVIDYGHQNGQWAQPCQVDPDLAAQFQLQVPGVYNLIPPYTSSDTAPQHGCSDHQFSNDNSIQALPHGLAMSGPGFDWCGQVANPCVNTTYNEQMPIHTNNPGFVACQSATPQLPVSSPRPRSVANTPRMSTTTSTSVDPFLSPYSFQTPFQSSNNHFRRNSNPVYGVSPISSYSQSQTPSMSFNSTPQTNLSYARTPSSAWASPDDSSPHTSRSYSQYKAPVSPMGQYRVAPYTVDRAQRGSWPPSRRKPHLGQSMSESHVPQMASFQSALSEIRSANGVSPFSTFGPQGLAPAPDLSSQVLQASDDGSVFATNSQYDKKWTSAQALQSSIAISQASTAQLWPTPSHAAENSLPLSYPPSPPPEDMYPADPWLTPFRDHPKCDGDVYTPKWQRRTPDDSGRRANEGWCGLCTPGRWLNMKNSRYWDDKWSNHGISAKTRQYIPPPVEIRGVDGVGVGQEGKCGGCGEWVAMDSKRKRMLEWWRHARKDCPATKIVPGRMGYANGGAQGLGLTQVMPFSEPSSA